MQFAVVNSSKALSSSDVEFFVVACAQQLVEFAAAWNIDPWAAAFYSDVTNLPQDDIVIAWIVDALDEPDALGYHSVFGSRPYVKVLAQGPATSVTLSHEFLETIADPTADRWMPKGDGTEVAVEVCDPVEGDVYPQVAEVAGEGRTVDVSDYVLPPYFDRSLSGATSRTGLPLVPFGIRPGGYQVVLGRDGNESQVFAHIRACGDGIYAAAAKRRRPDSRLSRRLAWRKVFAVCGRSVGNAMHCPLSKGHDGMCRP